jgi:phosphotransferase system HPr (HPr) family protein
VISKDLMIINKLGLHARAASTLVKTASGFGAEITIEKGGSRANAKSIMGLMLLSAAKGQTIRVIVDGRDEGAALAAVEALIRDRFHEE